MADETRKFIVKQQEALADLVTEALCTRYKEVTGRAAPLPLEEAIYQAVLFYG